MLEEVEGQPYPGNEGDQGSEWTSGGGRMLGMPRLDLEGFNILEVY